MQGCAIKEGRLMTRDRFSCYEWQRKKALTFEIVFLAPYSIDSVVIPLTTRLETDDYTHISKGTRLNNEDYTPHAYGTRSMI